MKCQVSLRDICPSSLNLTTLYICSTSYQDFDIQKPPSKRSEDPVTRLPDLVFLYVPSKLQLYYQKPIVPHKDITGKSHPPAPFSSLSLYTAYPQTDYTLASLTNRLQ